jgi:hypothetical protein
MLFKEIIVFYSEKHMKPVNTPFGQNAEILIVKAGGTYSYHWVLNNQSEVWMELSGQLHAPATLPPEEGPPPV